MATPQPAHARKAPSGAFRWLVCPGCIDFCESLNLPHDSSEAMELGTGAHSLLELALKEKKPASAYRGKDFNLVFTADDRMVKGVQFAIDTVKSHGPFFAMWAEERLAIPCTGEHGTVDVLAISKDFHTLHVFDYKNGVVPVDANKNPQTMLYAQGGLEKAKRVLLPNQFAKIADVHMHILQPNSFDGNPYKDHVMTVKQLTAWCENTVAPIAKLIDSGKAPLIPGPHCTGCGGAKRCVKRAKYGAEVARMDFADFVAPGKAPAKKGKKAEKPVHEKLTNAQIAGMLANADFVISLFNDIRKEAMAMIARDPTSIPGWKLVRAKSNRRWRDAEEVAAALKAMKLREDDYAPRKLAGLGDISVLIPALKREKFLAKYAVKPEGKPTLAPESDPRPALAGTAKLDFSDEIESGE
jgi:hypothetical protein